MPYEETLANRERDSMLPREEYERERVTGGILNIRWRYEPATLNNMVRRDSLGEAVCTFLYPRLLFTERDTFELLPFTAQSLPEVSEDRLVYTWRLRKGLKWDDFEESGAYETTRDVKFSFELMKDEATGSDHVASEFILLKEIRVLDDHTFQAVYEKESPYALYKFGHDFRLMPAHLLEGVPRKEIRRHPIGRNPVGFGPYRFHHWQGSQEILLVRNDLNRDIFPKRFRPYLDGIRYRVIPDNDMVLQQFMRGEVDLCILSWDDWQEMANDEAFNKMATRHMYYLPLWFYIAWNNASPLFKDPKVRRAMTHMVRREEVLKSHLYGLAKVITGPLSFYSKAYDDTIVPIPFDPEKAVKLLREAGWEDHDGDGVLDQEIDGASRKFEFDFIVKTYMADYQEALLTALQEDLKGIGIIMKIREMEWSALLERLRARDYEAITSGFRTYPIFEDPYGIWHSSQVTKEGGLNRVGYRNPKVDALLEQVRTEFDEDKRYALLRAFHRMVHADQPLTFLYSLPSLVAINKRWRNVVIHKMGPLYGYEWWLPPEKRQPSDEVPR